MLQRIKSKKGFTLAELLIVVAIIAVLTAIAVPLFVGAINDAKDATKEANIRAVRGAAVVYILENTKSVPSVTPAKGAKDPKDLYSLSSTENSWELTGPWYATATLDKSGNIKKLVVNLTEKPEAYTEVNGEITCVVKIEKLTPTVA